MSAHVTTMCGVAGGRAHQAKVALNKEVAAPAGPALRRPACAPRKNAVPAPRQGSVKPRSYPLWVVPPFRLDAAYSPTADQPKAITQISDALSNGERFTTLLGATGTGKTMTMAGVIERVQRPTLVLAHNKTLAAQLCNEFRTYFPDNAAEYFGSY